jgi:hypothetical protein
MLLLPAVASAAEADATNFDPWAYCRSVRTQDFVAQRHLGKNLPRVLLQPARGALGLADDMPEALLTEGLTWRCMNAQVWACHVGANLPCWSKADTRRQPGEGTAEYCREHPDEQSVPMVASGRETVYEWRCRRGKPYISKQSVKVDARGFPVRIWYRVDAPGGGKPRGR